MTTPEHYAGCPDLSRTAHADNNEKFNQLLNSCQNPRAVYAALLAIGKAGTLGKLREGATV